MEFRRVLFRSGSGQSSALPGGIAAVTGLVTGLGAGLVEVAVSGGVRAGLALLAGLADDGLAGDGHHNLGGDAQADAVTVEGVDHAEEAAVGDHLVTDDQRLLDLTELFLASRGRSDHEERSEGRRVGNECVSKCRTWGWAKS